MAAILTLLLVIAFSMLVTKIATIALMHTGMSRDVAQFQARSALSGAGFTTAASEKVVNHPLRRRIISALILLGSAGLVTAISSLLLGFLNPTSVASAKNLSVLFLGIALLVLSSRSKRVDYGLSKIINSLLDRFTDIPVKNFSQLISVSQDYEISEIAVEENTWLADQSIAATGLIDEGILVLGIYRDPDSYLGTPRGDYEIKDDDRLVVYGRRDNIMNVSQREDSVRAKAEHEDAAAEQEDEQRAQDEKAGKERSDGN